MPAKTKKNLKKPTEADVLKQLVKKGLLKEVRTCPVPADRRREEHPPVEVEGEPVSALILRERR